MSSGTRPAISPLRFPHPVWRYLVLFQSWTQFQAWATLILVMVLILNGLIIVTESQLLPLEGVLIGAVLGSLFSVFMVLPTEFKLSCCSTKLFVTVENELEALGYIQFDSKADLVVYRQNLPKFLRWTEGNVSIERTETDATVKGAFIIVWRIRRSLLAI